MSSILARTSRHVITAFTPAKVMQSRLHRKVMTEFAEKVGLVYFGYVDQRNDDHRLVRGLTVSAQHTDNHYCIGTFKGYDMTLVERADTIAYPGKPTRTHDWIIMEFDLHTSADLPHVFVGLQGHNATFYANLFTKFSILARVSLGTFGRYDPEFTNRYAVYAPPARAIDVQRLIDPSIAKGVGDHFGNFTFELHEGILYMYAQDTRPTRAVLDKMLGCGIWLATALDERVKAIEA
jgi:hypothetical protein